MVNETSGRYLPEYREIRKKEKDFMNLCFNLKLPVKFHYNQFEDLILITLFYSQIF